MDTSIKYSITAITKANVWERSDIISQGGIKHECLVEHISLEQGIET